MSERSSGTDSEAMGTIYVLQTTIEYDGNAGTKRTLAPTRRGPTRRAYGENREKGRKSPEELGSAVSFAWVCLTKSHCMYSGLSVTRKGTFKGPLSWTEGGSISIDHAKMIDSPPLPKKSHQKKDPHNNCILWFCNSAVLRTEPRHAGCFSFWNLFMFLPVFLLRLPRLSLMFRGWPPGGGGGEGSVSEGLPGPDKRKRSADHATDQN